VGRRLFGAPGQAAALPQRAGNWLVPLAACALTMLAAVHTGSRASAPLAGRSNGASLFTVMLDAATASNVASYSLSQMDENMEWNVWPHASHHVQWMPRAATHSRLDVFSVIPTNR
jgi:hypothetical protein